MNRAQKAEQERPSKKYRRPLADMKVTNDTIVLSPREIVRKEFSERLTKALRMKRWNQSELARRATQHCTDGELVGRDAINSYIRGRILPTPSKLDAISKALNMEVHELMPSQVETLAERDNPPLELKGTADGRFWLKINQPVTLSQASRVIEVLNETKTT